MRIIYLFLSILIIMLDVYFLFILPRSIFYGILLSAFGAIGITLFAYSIKKENTGNLGKTGAKQ